MRKDGFAFLSGHGVELSDGPDSENAHWSLNLRHPSWGEATLVSFRVAGWPCEDLRIALVRRVHALTRTIPSLDAVRLSINYFNTDEELDRLAEAVAAIARHTPESLPQRPALVVVAADGEPA